MFRKQKQCYSPEGVGKSGKREYLQKGLAKIQKATLADEADKLQDALQLYTKGVDYLYKSLQYDNLGEEERKGLKENYAVYYDRVEKLKQILYARQQKNKENVKEKPSKSKERFDFSNEQANQLPSVKRNANQSSSVKRNANQSPLLENGRQNSGDSQVALLRHVQLKSQNGSANGEPLSTRKGSPAIPNRPAQTFEQRKLPEIPAEILVQDSGNLYETPVDVRQQVNALSKKPQYAQPAPKISAHAKSESQYDDVAERGQHMNVLNEKTQYAKPTPKGTTNADLTPLYDDVLLPLCTNWSTSEPKGVNNDINAPVVNGDPSSFGYTKRMPGTTMNKRQSTYNKNPEDLAAKGLKLLAHATEDDKNGQFTEAMKKYQHAVELIGFALKYGSLSESKMESLRSKSALYLDRVEKLKVLTNARLEEVEESREDRVQRFHSKSFRARLGGYVLINSPTVKWSDVVGLEMAKEMLKEHVILPIKYPNVFSNGLNSTKLTSLLFYGPPGSGKTFLLKAVFSKVNNTLCLSVTAADLVSKWVGESKESVKKLFALARENKPCIVFVDDMEYIGTFPSQNDISAVNEIRQEFYREMKGEGVNNDGVFFLGATSRPWALDINMKKSFDKCVLLELPDLPARMELLNLHMKELSHSLNEKQMLHLAQRTEGYSGADINCLINDAWMQPVRKLQAATHFKRVRTMSHTDGVYTPCDAGDEEAELMTFVDLRSDQIMEACLVFDDVLLSLDSMKKSVSDAEALKFNEFSKYNT